MQRVPSQSIEGVVVQALIAPDRSSMVSIPRDEVQVSFAGFEGDRHTSLTRPSGGRESAYARGTEIRNLRQISIVSEAELARVATALNLPAVDAATLGANLLLRGIPALSLLPPGTRLYFSQGVTLVVEEENYPCEVAGAALQAAYPDVPKLSAAFPKAALHLRGIVAWVERPGVIAPGDGVRVSIAEQVIYRLDEAQEG